MVRRQQAADRAQRPKMRSPGRWGFPRRVEREFWRRITQGLPPAQAAETLGVSEVIGRRWFREGGGMPPMTLAEPTGRYLSFVEREEIAILRAQGHGPREIGRRIGRDASTISRELRRNAATRSTSPGYRATTAQWKAEIAARRPKEAKLVANPRLREYVQERLAGLNLGVYAQQVDGIYLSLLDKVRAVDPRTLRQPLEAARDSACWRRVISG